MKKYLLILAIAAGFLIGATTLRADGPALPGAGFPASHYEVLWTKSPFSVATPDAVEESTDYSLVGVTQLDGVSYASLIEKQSQKDLLISSDKTIDGLKLMTITRSRTGSDTYATILKDGAPLTLKLESVPAAGAVAGLPGQQPSVVIPPGQNIPMPGNSNPPGNFVPGSLRQSIRMHRPPIHLPPMPGQGQQPQMAPPPTMAEPVQQHNVPPP